INNSIKVSDVFSDFNADLTENILGNRYIVLNRQFYEYDTNFTIQYTSPRLETPPSSVRNTGDQIKILNDNSYVLYTTLKLVPEIPHPNLSYHAGVLYKLNKNLEVIAFDTFGIKNEFPAGQNSIALTEN